MSIFKHNKRTGAAVPEMRKPIPMPPTMFIKDKRIKIIDKRYLNNILCLRSEAVKNFENEVNEALKDGWSLDEIRTIDTNEKSGFVAIMSRYEYEEMEQAKKGKWLTTDAYPHHVYCSECYKTYVTNEEVIQGRGGNYTYCTEAEFCPHCGVKMETEQEAADNESD